MCVCVGCVCRLNAEYTVRSIAATSILWCSFSYFLTGKYSECCTLKQSFKLNFLVQQKSNFTAVFGAHERNRCACVCLVISVGYFNNKKICNFNCNKCE